MPAVNPENLSRRIESVLLLLGEPRRFARACNELLEFYADRTKRRKATLGQVATARVLRVSRPVLRTLCNEIQHFKHEEKTDWLEAAELMWNTGVREGRFVAACLLNRAAQENAPIYAEAWAEACEDVVALERLASNGLSVWREQEPDVFIQVLKRWIDDHRLQVRHLALLSITSVSRDSTFDKYLPDAFRMLHGITAKVRGESIQSLYKLMRQLAKRSSAETAKFLLDESKAGHPGAKRLIRNTIESLPGNYHEAINRAL
ncbi:MAG: DNA alkylation repair protein [Anaerolineales bacterium]